MSTSDRLSHAVRRVRTDGVRPVARTALDRARGRLYLAEEHVWYQLDLAGDRPRRELPDDVTLVRAAEADLQSATQLGQRLDEVRERRAAGNDLWIARDEGGPLFRCWIYRGRAPVLAAPGGWLDLPDGTVCLEDSATSPRARGRGVAPGSWSGIADSLQQEGLHNMITKVGVDNEPSRRAVTKAGFREVGTMRLVKTGPRKRTTMDDAASGLGPELANRLAG